MQLVDNKNRKNELASKRKVKSMMELFERHYDETIIIVSLDPPMIQTKNALYRIDIAKNKIEKCFRAELKLIDTSDDF